MGFSIRLLATEAASKGAFLAVLGLEETETPDPHNAAPFSGAASASHYIVWQNLRSTRKHPAKEIAAASEAAPVTVFEVVETVMSAAAWSYHKGQRMWWIDASGNTLAKVGDPPSALAGIEQNQPEETGVFEVPGDLFQAITGFRHDAEPTLAFHALNQTRKPKPFWQIW